MRFFITGATGFVGGHLVEHLTAAGHDVRGMARTPAGAAVVRGFGGTPVVADLDTVTAADLAGVEVVVHAAAQLRPVARLVEGVWRLLRRRGEPPLSAFAIAMLSRSVTVRTDRARAELGWAPIVTLDEGLRALAGS